MSPRLELLAMHGILISCVMSAVADVDVDVDADVDTDVDVDEGSAEENVTSPDELWGITRTGCDACCYLGYCGHAYKNVMPGICCGKHPADCCPKNTVCRRFFSRTTCEPRWVVEGAEADDFDESQVILASSSDSDGEAGEVVAMHGNANASVFLTAMLAGAAVGAFAVMAFWRGRRGRRGSSNPYALLESA
eukprot:NODE_17055_length_963_cov_8.854067.p1 GENE.NODE_17055_length_963_cov_8.854067~~NODE_17055_length_963_cov_8.854067.p1  ORF type:complete len:192 (+),score=27.47 NODE_17055_length_963_cov_8.854067:155-730(+)